ncbi:MULTISPECIES: hypothetical protein [Mesorhizobium]|uniref:hypothetical protein n=1 Tax=Mesorhizobium sp. TaxID=1871066 RepID=UPI0004948056|nr:MULTISPECIES: hypothetical protein [Mesorhizobium]RWM68060.1 MAG: hypothetical protein EOR82_25830 [Mesorhizobium sp.]TIO22149.1 MAG: hypothetical protein E5X83_27120 [Mesorhizobium sp.]TJV62019.1 MAG: hypothetical protein E5X82_06620 [Mesorhizobium sp.]
MAEHSSSAGENHSRPAAASDPRLAFVYAEAVRGLLHQQNVVESLNTRAGNLIFATAFVSSLLGGRALLDGLGLWDWLALALLFLIGLLVVIMLWPYYAYTFRFDPEQLLQDFVDKDPSGTMDVMHRALALRIKTDMASNWRIIQRLRMSLQLALFLLLLELLAWLLAITRV